MSSEKRQIVVVRWCHYCAVYLNGTLLTYSENEPDSALLRQLGFGYRELDRIPGHPVPPEFEKDSREYWVPDALLADHVARHRKYRLRQIASRIESLEGELKGLVAERDAIVQEPTNASQD